MVKKNVLTHIFWYHVFSIMIKIYDEQSNGISKKELLQWKQILILKFDKQQFQVIC